MLCCGWCAECEVKPRLDWFYFGFILFAGTFALSAQLKRFRSTRFLPITAREHSYCEHV